jgi:hypothetical protein
MPCETFDCPQCGAVYAVRYTHSPTRDSESAYCQVCHQKMSQWNSTEQPSYALVKRPPRDRSNRLCLMTDRQPHRCPDGTGTWRRELFGRRKGPGPTQRAVRAKLQSPPLCPMVLQAANADYSSPWQEHSQASHTERASRPMPRDGAIIFGAVPKPDRQGGRMSMPVPSNASGTAMVVHRCSAETKGRSSQPWAE